MHPLGGNSEWVSATQTISLWESEWEKGMGKKSIAEETFLWAPKEDDVRCSNITSYMEWLKSDKGLSFEDYNSLWEWSVTEIEDFWQSIWEYLEIKTSKSYTKILSERKMPGANWFVGSELNYAEHVFRHMSSERPALMFQSEFQPLIEISWNELYQKVSSMAASLRNMGVQNGDRVVSYHRLSGLCQYRRCMVQLFTRFWHPQRNRSFQTDKTKSYFCSGWLSVRWENFRRSWKNS